MSRKIIAIAVCLVLISVGSYLFYHIGMTNKTTSNPYSAIPSSSALVLQINDALNVFQQITTTNIMWEEVNKTELFSRLNDNLVFLNHFAEKDEDVKRLFKKGKLLISGEKTSGMDYNFLFCVSIPSDVSNKSLTTLPKEIFDKIGEISKRKFQDLELVEVVLNSDSLGSDSIQKKFNYLVHHGLFIGSFDGGLVEKSVNTFINGDGLDKNAAFQHIKSTSAQDVDANLFIACKAFNNIAQLHLRPEESNAFLENIGQWIELDVQIKPDEINMNGFIQSSDSLDYNVDLFKNQVPQKIEAFQYIPDNVAFLMHLGLSNYRNYQEEYSKIFRTEDRKAKIQKLNDHFGVNMEEDFNSWIENEIVQIILEPTNGLSAEHHFGLLRSKNLQRSKTILQELVLKSNENTDYSPAVLLNQYEVNRINIRNLIPLLMGPRFKNLENAYYTFVNNYVLWGNSVEAINKYLIKIDRGNTLKLDPHFQNFEQHLSGESNVLIYSSIARSPEIYKEIVSTSLETGIDSNLAILRKFFGGAIQIISDKSNMYFTNFYLKYDPVYKKETSSLWELALDTISDMKPFLHTNHYTYNKEVLVQDINNKIYLISPTGKLLWKRQLDEPILGEVRQIDVLNNDKLQMLFNTKSKLYLIDRNGRDVLDYPITLRSDATTGLSLFDYDNDNKLRIMIPCEDRNIYAYSKDGKTVDGWDFKPSNAAIDLPLKHISISKRDYIIAIDRSGLVRGLSRKGKERLKLSTKLKYSKNNDYHIEIGQNLKRTSIVYTDSSGNFCRTYLNDQTEFTNFHSFSPDHHFLYADINNDKKKDIILCDESILAVHDQDKTNLLSVSLDTISSSKPIVFRFNNETKIGLFSPKNTSIYLFNEAGIQPAGFPMQGSSAFSIGDINKDAVYDLIVNGADGRVYAYKLE